MKVGIIGTGYVGLVTGTCFAETGNDVMCIDINEQKVHQMQAGEVPIYEPGLEELFHQNIERKRLSFSADLHEGVVGAAVVFLALPTPEAEDGSADLSYVLGAACDIGKLLTGYTVVVDKSTVPVGTTKKVTTAISENARGLFDVVSNPEFLREGQAVKDFMYPQSVIIGTSSERAARVMKQLYHPLVRRDPERFMVMDESSAETVKYAKNAFLATKITFANDVARFCEVAGADYESIRHALGADSRIGSEFMHAGPGWGGSCFPKDTLAFIKMADEYGVDLGVVRATIEANELHKHVVPKKVTEYFKGDVKGKTFALWGLAFKDNTDDIRESPALAMIDELTAQGAHIVAFDPQATDNTRRARPDNKLLSYAEDEYTALHDADALIIATNWKEFFNPDFTRMKDLLKDSVVFDGRNLYELSTMKDEGFRYDSMGRGVVDGR